ncbi:hypothetical protein FZEAL_7795 [Fusarium zealandicum]|uniref:F-box domain-containing protein n=1 Tax=Fusarium zealandicum TaxID=1053134 RepID=A0A8H4UFZ5_9HYPO|nr:hypothetical protein FZEAL_7795 [Fusarium zealandicum]
MSKHSSPKPSLLALPNEIQTRILTHFIPSCIKSIRVRSRNLQFLHYITVVKPELARHVKSIIFGVFSTHESNQWLGHDRTGPDDDEKPGYRNLIESVFTPRESDDWETWRQDWLIDLEGGCEDAEVALLLVVCKELQQLCSGEPYRPRTFLRLLDAAFKRGVESPRYLPLCSLAEIYHESEESKYGYLGYAEPASLFFQLPNARSYECVLPNGSNDQAEPFTAIPRRLSSVQDIYLRRSSITANVVHATVGACKALRTFEYTMHPTHMYDDEMMPRDMLEAILPHQETFEYLHVDFIDN